MSEVGRGLWPFKRALTVFYTGNQPLVVAFDGDAGPTPTGIAAQRRFNSLRRSECPLKSNNGGS